MKQKIVIADNHSIFRTGAARVIAVEDDFRIVGQCDDVPRLVKAAGSVGNAILLFGASLSADVQLLATSAAAVRSHLTAILEIGDSPQLYLQTGVRGILYRDATNAELILCLHAVARGEIYQQKEFASGANSFESDIISERVRERLSTKELCIIGLLLKGYKNKEIAEELGNSEQVIKNYLRSIFDKTGVSDRLELALFAIHHRLLARAAMQAGEASPGNGMPPDASSTRFPFPSEDLQPRADVSWVRRLPGRGGSDASTAEALATFPEKEAAL